MARDIRALHFERIEGTRAQERASSRQESTFREGGRGYESSEREDRGGRGGSKCQGVGVYGSGLPIGKVSRDRSRGRV
jgi:hypothetical protein